MKELIIDVATADERIRAVLMNGSRANSNLKPDKYQDYDIVFIVTDIAAFTCDHSWIKVFGEPVLLQLPDEMTIGEVDSDGFGYLMLFADNNRIDLTLYPLSKVTRDYWPDSLTVCLLDKDNLFNNIPPPTDSDYIVKIPREKHFHDVCNEFWWCSINVVRALKREEIPFAKEIVETTIRPMLMKMLEWKIGAENDFNVAFGKGGKFMKKYVSESFYRKLLQTYADAKVDSNWKALFDMTRLFEEESINVAKKLGFTINESEIRNAKKLLSSIK